MNEGLTYGEQGVCLVWVYRHETDADVLTYPQHWEAWMEDRNAHDIHLTNFPKNPGLYVCLVVFLIDPCEDPDWEFQVISSVPVTLAVE